MASNERQRSQGARTVQKRGVGAGGVAESGCAPSLLQTAAMNNAIPFNTSLEYSIPQMLQSASTLFLIFNLFFL